MRRRAFLLTPLAVQTARGAVRRELFRRAPGNGTAVMAYGFYTKPRGVEMVMIEQRWSRSDTVDVAFERTSADNGRTWGAAKEVVTGRREAGGMWRMHPRCGSVLGGRFFRFWTEGVLPNDDPLEGLRQWRIFYSVDGGAPAQIIHKGREYDAGHPLPGVYTGRNCAMLGDNTCVPVETRSGEILLPVQLSEAGEDGRLVNPGGGYTWTEAAVLTGRFRAGGIEWEMSETVKGDPSYTTRGLVEPTIAVLEGGRLMMVMRGSNDVKPELPGHKWVSYSIDSGRSWTAAKKWTYTNGEAFYSPSACSQLLRHSSGRLYWIGNITPSNPRGNRPRYPLVTAEVDRKSGLVMRETVQEVDNLRAGEDPLLTLSNFYAREDRETGEIAIHATRLFALASGWEGDGMLYRVGVGAR